MLKNKTLISPSEILSNKLMNWCRKCSVPIHEKNVFLILNISPFSHKLQTHALLSGLLPYKPVSHFNPCPRILNRATFLTTLLLRAILLQILRQDKWCTCIRNRFLRQSKPVVISHRLFLTGARILTMCLSPNCLMPESQVYAQIRNI